MSTESALDTSTAPTTPALDTSTAPTNTVSPWSRHQYRIRTSDKRFARRQIPRRHGRDANIVQARVTNTDVDARQYSSAGLRQVQGVDVRRLLQKLAILLLK